MQKGGRKNRREGREEMGGREEQPDEGKPVSHFFTKRESLKKKKGKEREGRQWKKREDMG